MAQNIYNDPEFFDGYSRMRRSVEGLDGAAEWPAMRAMLPDLNGLRIVDLGCGFGWFCRWAAGQGAAGVLGLDVSEKMLERARSSGSDPAIRYVRADLEQLDLDPASFDLAYSSLTLHYLENLHALLAVLAMALVQGGRLVFSIEHPIYMAPRHPGWVIGEDGRKSWPLDQYLVEGPRTTDWLVPGVIKHHRTLGATLNLVIGHGFTLTHVEEYSPTDAQIAARPELADERERPMFLLVSARSEKRP